VIAYAWDLHLGIDSDGDGDPANDINATGSAFDCLFGIGQTEIALVVRNQAGVASLPDITTVTVTEISVKIDIKPGEYPNTINLKSKGVIPVAFLSSETFDATTIDPLTITLRGEDFRNGFVQLVGKKNSKPMASIEDVDGDGDKDLLVKIDTEKLSAYGAEMFCIFGAQTYSGHVLSGADTIRIVPNK